MQNREKIGPEFAKTCIVFVKQGGVTVLKRVIVAGLLGGVVLIVWTFVVNGILGFRSGIDMREVQNERQVYEILKENVVEPGRYVCNPEPAADGNVPGEEPVFSILYSGTGHGTARRQMLIGLVLFLLAPMTGALLLSQASDRILTSYPRKVLFFTIIGVLFAVFSDLQKFGIGGYPLRDAVLLGAHSIVVWTLVGSIVAWRIKPMKAA